jgi:1-deoxy-D-xylulose-5-phosphate synthase
VGAVREALREALDADRPVVVHCKTIKGKGFEAAEHGGLEGMEKWHAAKPASIAGRIPTAKKPAAPHEPPKPPQYTTVFGESLIEECKRDDRVCGITAAMNSGTGLNLLQTEMPDRYYDVGIAEQHAILFAAGMALQGMKPVAAIYSTFLQRAFDQIVHDVALQNLDVVFAMDRAGLVGDDGPTHHGVFDISYMRQLPNMTLMAPRDEAQLVDMLHTAIQHDGPVGLRYPRGEAEGVPLPSQPQLIEIGKGEVLREGDRVALLGYGYGVPLGLGAAELLEQHSLDVTVADARFAKPLDAELIRALAADHELLVTIEENQLAGGFGSGVVELLADEDLLGDCRVMRVGIPDRYVTHGKPALLRKEVGLTPEAIAERVTQAVLDRSTALV